MCDTIGWLAGEQERGKITVKGDIKKKEKKEKKIVGSEMDITDNCRRVTAQGIYRFHTSRRLSSLPSGWLAGWVVKSARNAQSMLVFFFFKKKKKKKNHL